MPEKKQISQDSGTDSPEDNHAHDRIEAITCFFLSCWVTADILVDYGHNRIAVWVFYLALLFPIALLTHHARKGWPAWAKIFAWIFVFIVSVLPIFLFVVTYLANFSIVAKTLVVNTPCDRKHFSSFWCVHSRMLPPPAAIFQTEVSPVYVMLYVKFANERDSPMFVDGFSVETKTPSGHWEKMAVFDVNPSVPNNQPVNFYYSNVTNNPPDFKHALKMDLGDNFLQNQFAQKSINPREPVQGWVFLDIPKDGWTEKMRFSIATGGETITQPITLIYEKPNGMNIQTVRHSAGWFQHMDETDLSGCRVRYYSDGTNPNTDLFQ